MMTEENIDFTNFPGAISATDLPVAQPTDNGMPDFNSTAGAINVAELERAELALAEQPIIPVQMPQAPTAGQPMSTSGKSGFDNQGVNDFLNNYGKSKSAPVQEQRRRPQQHQVNQGDLSKSEQASLLNELFGSDKRETKSPAPRPKRPSRRPEPVIEEDYYDEELYDEEEYTDDRVVGCVCTDKCPNKTCIFYGRDNFLSINDIIETEIDDRIEYLIASGEIDDRRKDVRKQKLKKNRYLSDISESLLDL